MSWRPTSGVLAAPPVGVNSYDAPLEPFSLLNMTRDALGLVSALGYRRTTMLIGHDFGSPVAAYCALADPMSFPRWC